MKTTLFKITVCVTTLLLMSACFSNRPIYNVKAQNNATYKVEYLFEHDGCKIYRFMDNGNYVYFTNCGGDVTSISNDSTATRVQNVSRSNVLDEFNRQVGN